MSGDKHLPKLQLVGVCLRPDVDLFCIELKQRDFYDAAARLGMTQAYSWVA